MRNLFVYTETDYIPDHYPAFVSLNQGMGGCITLSVRSRSVDGLHQGIINLDPEQCKGLAEALLGVISE